MVNGRWFGVYELFTMNHKPAIYKYPFFFGSLEKKVVQHWVIVASGLLLSIVLGAFLSDSLLSLTGFQEVTLPPIPSAPGTAKIATCADGTQNQDETSIDCGGACVLQGKKCSEGKLCLENRDCTSDYCYVQTCRAKPTLKVTPILTKQPEPQQPKEKVIISTPSSSLPSPPRKGITHQIAIKKEGSKFLFVPPLLEAFTGDKVTWTNTDAAAHAPVALDRSFEASKLAEGQTWTLDLSTAGEINYHDDLHPSSEGLWKDFKGQILVRNWIGACDDKQKNLDETDIDCGGSCGACALGKQCKKNTECATKTCTNNLCSSPLPVSCADKIKNQDETDVDCGGICQKCQDGKGCFAGKDCLTGYCSQKKICLSPSCTDGEKSQDESDVDCGGPCTKCARGKQCVQNSDCLTEICRNGKCDIATELVQLTAKQFAFVPDVITVKQGTRVQLNVTSIDVPHGFSLPAYKILRELQPHVPLMIEFVASQSGTFEFVCSVYCGSGHGAMRGKLVVEKAEIVGEEIPIESREEAIFPTKIPQQKKWWWVVVIASGIIFFSFFYYRKKKKIPPPLHKTEAMEDYLSSMKKKGYSNEQIHHQLLQYGHTKEEAENIVAHPKESLDRRIKRLRRLGHSRKQIMQELLAEGHDPVAIHDAWEKTTW